MTVVLYTRVSTEEQARSGLGLAAQEIALRAEAERRGWQGGCWVEDAGVSGSVPPSARAGLGPALACLRRGDALAAARLDRISRSAADFSALMEDSVRRGFSIVALDLGVDTTTPAGEMVGNVMASFARYERRLIGARIREALAAKAAAGWRPAGRLSDADEARVLALRSVGLSERAIAAALSEQDGRIWHRGTVTRVLRRTSGS